MLEVADDRASEPLLQQRAVHPESVVVAAAVESGLARADAHPALDELGDTAAATTTDSG